MVARLLRSFIGKVHPPVYRVSDEAFWKSQMRRSFLRGWLVRRGKDKLRP
jgi:hypothetical protein